MIATLRRSFWPWTRLAQADAPPRATSSQVTQPVFIHDAVTPVRGETMLLILLRDQAARGGSQS